MKKYRQLKRIRLARDMASKHIKGSKKLSTAYSNIREYSNNYSMPCSIVGIAKAIIEQDSKYFRMRNSPKPKPPLPQRKK